MIITEFCETRFDGVKLYRTYSDKKVYIRQEQTSAEYSEAIDVENAPYTYTETDKPIDGEQPETDLTVSDTLEMLSELGVDTDD